MGESERYIDRRFKKINLGEDNNSLVALIGINGVAFLILGLIQVIYYMVQSPVNTFGTEVLPWFIMPAKLSLLVKAPWTFFLSMFVHTGIILTFTNMLWLWAFGSIFQDIAGNNKVIPVYIYGGLAGAVIFIASNYAIPQSRQNIGFATLQCAHPSIMAISVETYAFAPDFDFFSIL